MMYESSLMERMMPRIPPEVVTRSPDLMLPSISCHCFCFRCCGRIIMKYRSGMNSRMGSIIPNPPPPGANGDPAAHIAKLVVSIILARVLRVPAPPVSGSGHRLTRQFGRGLLNEFVSGKGSWDPDRRRSWSRKEGLRQLVTCPRCAGGIGAHTRPAFLRNPTAACFLFDTTFLWDSGREKAVKTYLSRRGALR